MNSISSKKTSADRPVVAPLAEGPATVQVGRLVKAHGVRGEALVEILTDRPAERFVVGASLQLTDAAGQPRRPPRLTVQTTRPYRDALLIQFAEVTTPEAMTALRGAFLEVPTALVPPPPEGTYYHFQLVGCRCHDAVDGDLGRVTDVLEDGGGLLLQVERTGATLLLPFVQALIERVDIGAREIHFRLPSGLVEACASKS